MNTQASKTESIAKAIKQAIGANAQTSARKLEDAFLALAMSGKTSQTSANALVGMAYDMGTASREGLGNEPTEKELEFARGRVRDAVGKVANDCAVAVAQGLSKVTDEIRAVVRQTKDHAERDEELDNAADCGAAINKDYVQGAKNAAVCGLLGKGCPASMNEARKLDPYGNVKESTKVKRATLTADLKAALEVLLASPKPTDEQVAAVKSAARAAHIVAKV
jgi:hypothetical protein